MLIILLEVKSYGHTAKEILFDNEQVFNAVGKYVISLGIEPLYTPSGLHNNLAERYTQFFKTQKRILLCSLPYELPKYLSFEAILTVVRSCNISRSYKPVSKSP